MVDWNWPKSFLSDVNWPKTDLYSKRQNQTCKNQCTFSVRRRMRRRSAQFVLAALDQDMLTPLPPDQAFFWKRPVLPHYIVPRSSTKVNEAELRTQIKNKIAVHQVFINLHFFQFALFCSLRAMCQFDGIDTRRECEWGGQLSTQVIQKVSPSPRPVTEDAKHTRTSGLKLLFRLSLQHTRISSLSGFSNTPTTMVGCFYV